MPNDVRVRQDSLYPTVSEKDAVKQKEWDSKYQITNTQTQSKTDTEKLQENTCLETPTRSTLTRPITRFTNPSCQITEESNQTKLFCEERMLHPSFDDVTTKVCGPKLNKNQTKSFKQNSKKFFGPQQKCKREISFEDSIRHKFKRRRSSSLNEISDKQKHDLEKQSLSSNGTILSE